ncbi:MAG: 3-hydroxy acid dehydrogenase/malonic semialdehyde reductase [Planctomycetota bacterium]|jgi:3-hydroxy acid dehydrogenase/malonic semialdehyde reductase
MNAMYREQSLSGKRALITGASAGIGAATARALAGAGAHVTLAARRRERLEELAAELGEAEIIELDVRDAEAVNEAVSGLELDICIPNAGLAFGSGPIQEGDPADWSVMIDTNVKGVLHVVRAALPGMIERGDGDFVILGSVAGRQVYPGGNVYNATKHAVRAIYEAMRLDAAGSGVRFTTVDPGMVETEFSKVRFGGDEEKAKAVYAGMDPIRPEDVADAILWAITRPPNINIGEIVMWARAQASTTLIDRRDA